MEPLPLDDVLVKTYETFDIPVDPLIGAAGLTEAFVTAGRRQAGGRGSDSQAIMRRLTALRKKGRLPRLRRAHFGREFSSDV